MNKVCNNFFFFFSCMCLCFFFIVAVFLFCVWCKQNTHQKLYAQVYFPSQPSGTSSARYSLAKGAKVTTCVGSICRSHLLQLGRVHIPHQHPHIPPRGPPLWHQGSEYYWYSICTTVRIIEIKMNFINSLRMGGRSPVVQWTATTSPSSYFC